MEGTRPPSACLGTIGAKDKFVPWKNGNLIQLETLSNLQFFSIDGTVYPSTTKESFTIPHTGAAAAVEAYLHYLPHNRRLLSTGHFQIHQIDKFTFVHTQSEVLSMYTVYRCMRGRRGIVAESKMHNFASLNMQLEAHWLNELITAIANSYWE